MSNELTITLTEFKTRESDEVHCGFFAYDNEGSYAHRVAGTWDEFKQQFPTLKSIIEHVADQDAFLGLEDAYYVDGNTAAIHDNDQFYGFDSIVLEGIDGLYDED